MRTPSRSQDQPPDKRRVLVVTQSMGSGGAERAVVTMLRFLDRSRFSPSLALFCRTGPFLSDVPSDVAVHDLGERNAYDWLGPTRRLGRLIDADRPSVVISVLRHPNLVSLVASRFSGRRPPVVVVEQSALSRGLAGSRTGPLKAQLHRWLYPTAAAIVAVSHGVKEDLIEQIGETADRAVVIPNPCDRAHVERLAEEPPDRPVDWSLPTLVAVGRLDTVKGFDLLLDAVAKLRSTPGWQVVILGEGPLLVDLSGHARRLGIGERVRFLGFRTNPFAYMARARALVLSSVAEAFANVLVEAMACGTPVVSVDCPHGPREILQDGACGLLVAPGEAAALAMAIERVLTDADLAAQLSTAGKVRAKDFAADVVVRAYEGVLEEACRCKGAACAGATGHHVG